MKTKNEILEGTIETLAKSWFGGLQKSWKTDDNRASFEKSYRIVAERAVEAYKETERIRLTKNLKP
ncbi:MAG: hypothetical protein IMZ64_07455 [Bacteroidetes bacterium]|nr:hypothetical protein [Bacteroidota bacterium]